MINLSQTMQTNLECMSLMGRLRIISSTCNTDEHGAPKLSCMQLPLALFDKEIYIFTPTFIRVDRRYTWIRIPPYPPQVELVIPPKDEPWPRLLDEIDDIELGHTLGSHYDVVQTDECFYSLLKPTLGA